MDHPELRKVESAPRIIEAAAPTLIAKGKKFLHDHGPAIMAIGGILVCMFVLIRIGLNNPAGI